MFQSLATSVRRKLMLVVLATTFVALLISAIAMAVYETRNYHSEWIDDLSTQAELLARASVPALAFDDERAARENLSLLRVRPDMRAAAIYLPDGRLFASWTDGRDEPHEFPDAPGEPGHEIRGNEGLLHHRIVEGPEVLGTLYLRARYGLLERLTHFVGILGTVMVASLLAALLLSAWLQRAITRPIIAVTQAAHRVMDTRDFSLRVHRTTRDELGYLVDAFNAMLAEVGRRSEALEASNRSLQHEMQERRAAEDALRLADRRKDEFLATLAHELRNPLAPLRNALQILAVAGDDEAVAREARQMMERQLRQMVRLVDDLLDVSRITTGKLAIRREPAELQSIVRNAVEQVGPFVTARRHALSVQLPAEPVIVQADATRLAQVFSNLLHNAAKYTDPGGRIRLQAAVEESAVVVRVGDTGIGLSPEALSQIFEMFAQVDQSLERVQAGLGVGLTLARRLVELHGGTISAHSAGLGRGSEFVVRLPLAPSVQAVSPHAVHVPRAGTSRLRILLADDNVDFASSFALLLRSAGHEVRVVHDGAAALAMAAEFRPQVAILDIGLPAMNGYELARRIREQTETADTLLIAVTGWGQDKDRRQAREAGFDHHLVKPVEPGQIEAILESGNLARQQPLA
ncbi:MAG TPA: ATP-binding protein [Burkholderiaceae bacterium]|jgi:two-component system, sensor histidine kinase|nr:ATP-binding protein [Burkholderiaceae bacterium]